MAAKQEYTYEELLQRVQNLELVNKSKGDIDNLRLAYALESAKIGIYEWDIAKNEFVWDERMCEFWGIPFGKPLNLDFIIKGIHQEDRSFLKSTIDGLIEKGPHGKSHIQCRVVGIENGINRWLELTGHVLYENGKPSRVIGTARDISEQKSDEEKLKKWENIFLFAKLGTYIDSVDGKKIELINPEFASMHGYSVEELSGPAIETFLAPEYWTELPLNQAIANEKGHHVWESVHIKKMAPDFR
jgi:PAS domain S-box-containing protein